MTSKKLGAILRSVPPATAVAPEDANTAEAAEPKSAPPAGRAGKGPKPAPAIEPEVPLQVLIPERLRRELAIMAEQGVSLRHLVLRAIRELGLGVTDADIQGKRGRRKV